ASSPSAGLLMWGVPSAPTTELPDLDPVRRVAPGLVRLVVAALALFAGECHADANVRGHFSSTSLGSKKRGRTEKNPRPQARGEPKNSAQARSGDTHRRHAEGSDNRPDPWSRLGGRRSTLAASTKAHSVGAPIRLMWRP